MATITEPMTDRLIPKIYERMVDTDPRPLILVGPNAWVLRANPAAMRLIGRTDVLRLDRGKVTAALPHVTTELHRKIGLAIDEPAGTMEAAGTLVMPLPGPGGMRPLMASITSLHAAHPLLEGATVAAAALWLDDPMEDVDPSAGALRTWFGLTPAEARVAIDLTNGLSPKEIAAKHDRHIRTVRTQIESVFGKLGVTRAAQLVRVITRAAGMAGSAVAAQVIHALDALGIGLLDTLLAVAA